MSRSGCSLGCKAMSSHDSQAPRVCPDMLVRSDDLAAAPRGRP